MKPHHIRLVVNLAVALAVLVGSFVFYVYTGPADVAYGEGAHFQRRVVLTEIGEGPWDRPLYVLLSQPFLLIPWDSLPRRAGLASAAFAAVTCLLIFLLLRVLLEVAPQFIARRVGVLAAISLGVAHIFWLRAVTPGPEVLDGLLLATILYSLVRFANEGRVGYLYAAMLVLGLSLSNNLMMVFLVPFFIVWVRVVKPPLVDNIGLVRFRGLLLFLGGSVLALVVAAWGWSKTGFEIPAEQLSWLTFWRGNMMLGWDTTLQQSLVRFGAMLLYNFPPWTAVIGLLGLLELFKRHKYVFWLIFPLGLIYTFLVITLTLAEPLAAYLPVWVLFSVAVGYGWWKVLSESTWLGFVVALVLSLSPLLLYRYAPLAIEKTGEQVRVRSLLGLPLESPIDPIGDFLNPDRRVNSEARNFAQETLSSLPEGARVLAPSRAGMLLFAPARYLQEVEQAKPGLTFHTLGPNDEGELQEWIAQGETPLFLVGLHPPNPLVEKLLDTNQFVPNGYLFRPEPREPTPAQPPEGTPPPIDQIPIAGEWSGFARPQGYTVHLSIQEGLDGNYSGRAVLNRDGAQPFEGIFSRISLIGESFLGRVTYNERVHIHIDAKQFEDRLEGYWQIFEVESLTGTFTIQKQP